jgi:hypothetical protein
VTGGLAKRIKIGAANKWNGKFAYSEHDARIPKLQVTEVWDE